LTSNIGHLLWTGIVPDDRAPQLADLLVSPAMFSGWGLLTLAATAAGYNPLSYHCGSVWPHDTALAIAGLARYGCDEEAHRLALALIETSSHNGGRLPELFAGFDRSDLTVPVPYPASCIPQAWAAASSLLIVRSLLGLEPDLLTGRVVLRPRLPEGMSLLSAVNVELGSHRLEVRVHGDEVEVELDGSPVDQGTPGGVGAGGPGLVVTVT
jgi:glycogen debranching enzyme